jgi:hypothetical protein
MNELALHVPAVADAAGKCAPGLPSSFCHHHSLSGCVGGNGLFCFGWAVDNFDRYVSPFFRHLEIVSEFLTSDEALTEEHSAAERAVTE